MSMVTQNTRLNNSRDVANVWITSGTTKLILSKDFSKCKVIAKRENASRHGASIVKQEESKSQTYKWRFDPLKFFLQKISGKRR